MRLLVELHLIFLFYNVYLTDSRTPTHPLRGQLAGDLSHIVSGFDAIVGQIEQKEIHRLKCILKILVLIGGFFYKSTPAESQIKRNP